MGKDFKVLKVEGIAMYACVHRPKKGYSPEDVPSWTIDLVVSDAVADHLQAEGLRPAKVKIDEDTKKNKEYGGYLGKRVFGFRRKAQKLDGTDRQPPEVVDSDAVAIPPHVLIGNGSKVVVKINPYTIKIKGKDTVCCDLMGVQVLELVKYVRSTGFHPQKSGFKVASVAHSDHDDDSDDQEGGDKGFNPF